MSEECIFCKIAKGELPSNKVYEDDKVLGFLDIVPINPGHSLIIPKEHFVNIYDTPEDVLASMIKAAKTLAKSTKAKLNADGINITMNNDSAAGQVVHHNHIHVIPRFVSDGFDLWHGKTKYKEGEAHEIASKISGQAK